MNVRELRHSIDRLIATAADGVNLDSPVAVAFQFYLKDHSVSVMRPLNSLEGRDYQDGILMVLQFDSTFIGQAAELSVRGLLRLLEPIAEHQKVVIAITEPHTLSSVGAAGLDFDVTAQCVPHEAGAEKRPTLILYWSRTTPDSPIHQWGNRTHSRPRKPKSRGRP